MTNSKLKGFFIFFPPPEYSKSPIVIMRNSANLKGWGFEREFVFFLHLSQITWFYPDSSSPLKYSDSNLDTKMVSSLLLRCKINRKLAKCWIFMFYKNNISSSYEFYWKYFLDSLFDFIILKFVYKRFKVHSTKLSNIMLLPWWFERLRSFHFKKLRNNFRVCSDRFSGKFSKEIFQCVEEIFIWRNW